MSTTHFTSKLLNIKGYYLIRLPIDASQALPSRGMVMARVMIETRSILVALEPDGTGGHWFHIEPALARRLQASLGDGLMTTLEVINEWPEPDLPQDLSQALHNKHLTDQWHSLTVKARWDWLRWVRSTKNITTRSKRIEVMCSKLSSGDRRPCCFNRNICTITKVSKNGVLLESE